MSDVARAHGDGSGRRRWTRNLAFTHTSFLCLEKEKEDEEERKRERRGRGVRRRQR